MDCPRCGLINPESAQRCDCGYDFEKKAVDKAYFTQALPKSIKTFLVTVVVANILGGLLALTRGRLVEITITIIWSAVIYWLYSRLIKKDNRARIALVVLAFPIGLVLGLSNEAKLYCLQK